MAIRDLQAVIYTDDEGNQYVTAQDAAIFAQGLTGGADYTGSPELPPLPGRLRPRGVYVGNGTNRRFVVALTSDATLFASGGATSINLRQIGAADPVSYTRLSTKSEKRPNKRNPAG